MRVARMSRAERAGWAGVERAGWAPALSGSPSLRHNPGIPEPRMTSSDDPRSRVLITPESLASTGTSELATALSRALPSLNFPRPAITDGTDAVRPAQLRGLAPDQVLVLVNGKRRHTTALINLNGSQGRGSSPVDLNAIPIAAVERGQFSACLSSTGLPATRFGPTKRATW